MLLCLALMDCLFIKCIFLIVFFFYLFDDDKIKSESQQVKITDFLV